MPKSWKLKMREGAGSPSEVAPPVSDIRGTILAAAGVNPETPQLDLHGKNVAEALRELDDFLDQAVYQSQRTGKIIFGIGTGALRKVVAMWLAEKKAEGEILEYRFSDRNVSATFLLLE
ncbi:MAG: Smr/MutS family protein [Patescibacteria group bacterium]|jgi:dsDNA-specific endonuclease/ATPase MutS2